MTIKLDKVHQKTIMSYHFLGVHTFMMLSVRRYFKQFQVEVKPSKFLVQVILLQIPLATIPKMLLTISINKTKLSE